MITCEELCLGTLSASSLFFPWWEPILSDETPREIYDSWFPLGGSVLRQRVEFRESLSLHWLDFNCLPLKIINMSLIMVACWWAPPVVFWRGIFCCPSLPTLFLHPGCTVFTSLDLFSLPHTVRLRWNQGLACLGKMCRHSKMHCGRYNALPQPWFPTDSSLRYYFTLTNNWERKDPVK